MHCILVGQDFALKSIGHWESTNNFSHTRLSCKANPGPKRQEVKYFHE